MAVWWNKALVVCAVGAVAGCATQAPSPVAEAPDEVREKPRLAVTPGSVTLSDVPLGVPVALRLPDGGYYLLRNDSAAPLRALVTPMSPPHCQRIPGQPVYSPVTNMEWVVVEPREVTIPPHSETEAMVVVTLPKDDALRGAHLEFWLRAQALLGPMGSVALFSRVRLDVAEDGGSGYELVVPRPAAQRDTRAENVL